MIAENNDNCKPCYVTFASKHNKFLKLVYQHSFNLAFK